tara:strand:- start:83 stop:262 length:180 start_codon:yes stop_codon:yes gene_type:complete
MDRKVMIGELTRVVDSSNDEPVRQAAIMTRMVVESTIPLSVEVSNLVYSIINKSQEHLS